MHACVLVRILFRRDRREFVPKRGIYGRLFIMVADYPKIDDFQEVTIKFLLFS